MLLLDKDKLYALLVKIYYSKEGKFIGLSPIKSLIVTGNYKVNLIVVNIINGLNKVINQYILIVMNGLLVLIGEIGDCCQIGIRIN
jgi:hypothetical protein